MNNITRYNNICKIQEIYMENLIYNISRTSNYTKNKYILIFITCKNNIYLKEFN